MIYKLLSFLMLCGFWGFALGQAYNIPNEPTDISPLLVGERLPNSSIQNIRGENIMLHDILKRKKLNIVIVYRGGWCPYCSRHLSRFAIFAKKNTDQTIQLIAISPDGRKENKDTQRDHPYMGIYADYKQLFIKDTGLAFKASKRYNNTLDKFSDNTNSDHLIPVPSLFIVDRRGNILFEHINPDYSTRIEIEYLYDIVQTLKRNY